MILNGIFIKRMQEFYRNATAEELQFYRQSLYPLQDRVFETASLYGDHLYLTGGTALARFYFQHRLSEDLDFFVLTDDLKQLVNGLSARAAGARRRSVPASAAFLVTVLG